MGAVATVQVGGDGGLVPSGAMGAVRRAGFVETQWTGLAGRVGGESEMKTRVKSERLGNSFFLPIALCFINMKTVSDIPSTRHDTTAPTSPSPSPFLMGLRRDHHVVRPEGQSVSESGLLCSELPPPPVLVSSRCCHQ